MSWSWVIVGSSPGRTLIRGLALGAVLLGASQTVVVPVRALGISMLPTYADGQLLFFNALAFRVSDPARGDIVAIGIEGDDAVLVKRVIGLPGERLRLERGTVFIDGAPLDERYVRHRSNWTQAEVVLGTDEYFVIGDNRGMPARNHTFGTVSRAKLRGRLMF